MSARIQKYQPMADGPTLISNPVYVGKKWIEFATPVIEGTVISKNYEMVSIEVEKPNFKHFFCLSVYIHLIKALLRCV